LRERKARRDLQDVYYDESCDRWLEFTASALIHLPATRRGRPVRAGWGEALLNYLSPSASAPWSARPRIGLERIP
jgi:hypothetical protein